jgi:HSP20 family protein
LIGIVFEISTEKSIYKPLKFNTMTLLKVYNKNGHCRPVETPAFGFTDLFNEFPFRNLYSPESYLGAPRVNIKEQSESFTIQMEVPGIDKNLLKMDIDKDLLTISYKTEETKENEGFTYREFNYQTFERSFRIPETVDKEKVSANYNEGILTVTLPKLETALDKGPRTIEIS